MKACEAASVRERCPAACGVCRRCKVTPPRCGIADVLRVHDYAYVKKIRTLCAQIDDDPNVTSDLDADTGGSHRSFESAMQAAGAVTHAIDRVGSGECRNAFCPVRPPGHHAEESAAMGFCFYNSGALAAHRALNKHRLERVAILDFDVHHGNGTVDAFQEDPRVLVCSSFQFPHYPYRLQKVDRPNIVNTPLAAGTTGLEFRMAIERDWLPAIDEFAPALLLISAGFDAHRDDPLGDLLLDETDFRWITSLIADAANRHADGRIVSILEGGYHLDALARSVATHLEELIAK